jgi:hypothetical protein
MSALDELKSTPRYDRVVAASRQVAWELGHNYVGSRTSFLAMVQDAVPTKSSSRFLPPAQDDDAFYDLITSEGWGSGKTHKVEVQPSSRLGSPGWFSVGADCTTASSRGRSSPK